MSNLVLDVLMVSKTYIPAVSKKEQSMFRSTQNKYDFEKYLFENNISSHNITDSTVSIKEHDSENLSGKAVLSQMVDSINENSLPGYQVPVSCKQYYSRQSDVMSVKYNKGQEVIKITDQLYMNYISAGKNKDFEIKVRAVNNNEPVKSKHQSKGASETECFRIVKTNSNYTLYLNFGKLGLPVVKLIDILKRIEAEKNIYFDKVVLNREVIFNKKPVSSIGLSATHDFPSTVNYQI